MRKKKLLLCLGLSVCGLILLGAFLAGTVWQVDFHETLWSLLPPFAAIVLALITREVYSSLFFGLLIGALLKSRFQPVLTLETLVKEGLTESLGEPDNIGILIFLVVLGIFVSLLSRSGGTAAYGRWAQKRIRSRRAAMLTTFFLGVILSVDDYFNTLTVGNVMRPITDTKRISRAKLAYIIDATAAPMCMIMPISSWAAAVSSNIETTSGVDLFIRAIPFNFYSLLTLYMVVLLSLLQLDFGKMALHERNARGGDLFTVGGQKQEEEAEVSSKALVMDLFIPVIVLIIFCVGGLLYTGGFFEGKDLIQAFSDCSAPLGLSMGAVAAMLFSSAYYALRRLMNFNELMDCICEGFRSMVPAILILVLAWSLSNMTLSLGARSFVGSLFASTAGSLDSFLPPLVFLVSVGLAFATGSSWGTMSILLPIIDGIGLGEQLFIITISACLAGAVCGDHCSPISDTNIMSSAAARCNHIAHVTTQLPYASIVLVVSLIGYVLAGLTHQILICLPLVFFLLTAVIFGLYFSSKRRQEAQNGQE